MNIIRPDDEEDSPLASEAVGSPAVPTYPVRSSVPPPPETAEVPELNLTVAGRCKETAGNYVGLSRVQRDRLGVNLGDVVEL